MRQHLAVRRDHLIAELRAQPTDALSEFLHNAGVELADVLKRGERSFTLLRRDAGLVSALPSPLEAVLAKRVRAVAHVDDARRAAAYTRLLSANAPDYQDLSGAERRLADMLYFSMFPGGGQHTSIGHGLRRIRHETELAGELAQVIELALDGTRHTATPLTGRLVDIPLLVHATYQREEALAALGYASLNRLPNSFREGVLRIDTGDGEIDAFFVTLRKSEADYSPTTMYADYPISPTLFHWESQSTTSVASPTGQRYLHGTGEKLLFVRTEKEGEFGTMPYVFLGPVDYVSHRGDRPIAITWRLRTPMPADLFTEAAVAL
ncbi:MAG TPA: DUF3427 domain-containing protein [Dermatophilaceae bacterium]|nr:DUF3427 domain-containing protein [Dermatophilaceae bacterium]